MGRSLSAEEARRLLKSDSTLSLIDVREVEEFRESHVPGSVNLPLSRLEEWSADLPADGDYLILCRSGRRSQLAADDLTRRGVSARSIEGGIQAWSGDRVESERIDLYDKDRHWHGETIYRGEDYPSDRYPLIIKLLLFNSKDQVLIQKRQASKSLFGGLWDFTVSGMVQHGENSEAAVRRELKEELNLNFPENQDLRPTFTLNFSKGMTDFYIETLDVDAADLDIQESEVQAVKWATPDQVRTMIHAGDFVNYQPQFLEWLFALAEGAEMLNH